MRSGERSKDEGAQSRVAHRGRNERVSANSTVSELFEAVIQHLESIGREATTIVGYRQIAKDAGEHRGSVSLRKLNASRLNGYYAHMLNTGRNPSSVKRHHAFIHRCLKQAHKLGWVQENVADRASPPRRLCW